ncbi:MAG TPA: Calx-beta domain-containing protein, partial [Thermoanaerobaculia bacterium]|nr:Calx-beta domain-containing protein [Thermoanaerobaculia bacterium]
MAAPRPIVPRVFVPSLTRIRSALFTLLVLIAAVPAADAASVVVGDGTDAHHSALPTDCANSGTAPCGLWDAITYLNSQSGPNNITFSVATVTLSADLPAIQVPVTIDGSFGAPRVVLDGGNTFSGINISDTAGGTTPGSGSTIENLVIQQMGSEGIAIVGGGNSVYNCYIGTDITGLIAMGNQGDGISITSTGAAFTFPPDLSATAGNAIGDPIDPTKGNLISGNTGIGVDIFGQRTVLNVVALNKIGTDKTGITGMANGSHGVAISGNAFGNTIGPGNIISGNSGVNADGINITGTVMAPNVVTANIIGPPSTIVLPALGNGRDGIRIDSTLFDVSLPDVAEIGPLNIIGQSGEDGIQITGSCQKVRVFGNFIGVAEDPNSAGTFIDIGNARDGIRVGTPGHQIGGTTLPETNVISANNDSGVYFVTTNATDTTIQGNIIGRDPLNLINFPNTKDGITFDNAGSNTVGGTASGEANVIAGNGREGIKLVNSSAWADLISGNSIFGNHILENGLGIDLDFTQEDVDPTDNLTPSQDPNTAYSNHGQNAPVVGTGVSAPHYDPATGHTVVNWTLETRSNAPITLEFFGSDAPGFNNHGEGQVYLGTVMVVTDGTGLASGSSDIAPPSAYDSRGKYITMTATDTTAETTRPGNTPIGPANNTSEFSNAVLVPNPGILQFSSPIYSVAENGVTATITVSRIGGSDTAVSVDYATSDGTATAPADYTTSTGTLNWADGDSADKTFTVPIVNDTTFEGSETVNLALSNPTAFAELGVPPAAILTITDDDTAPAISISDASQLEGNSGSSTMNFTVTLSNPSTQTVTVDFATADGTAATGDADYAAATGTVNFPPLSTSQQISVTINGDTKFEPDEAFNVNLTNPSNATIADNQGVGTIQNDDAQPTISITDVAQAEGNLGPTPFVFAVSLSNASSQTVSVNYTTTDGTATLADADYVSATGTITFPPGSTSQPLIVTVNGDTKFE